jgi:hypothetical protein
MAANQQAQQPVQSPYVNIVTTATSLFGILIAAHMTRDILYRVTNDDVLWIVVFLQLFVLLTLVMVWYAHTYKPREGQSSEGYQSRAMALFFVQMTALMTGTRFLVDLILYGISITRLTLTHFYLLFLLGMTLVFVVFFKMQRIFDAAS